MLRVVIAPDSFKGSMSATSAAAALAQGWRSVRPDDELVVLPQADGGEGTLDAVEAAHPAAQRRAVMVTGPDQRPARAEWLLLPDGEAVVEFAQSSGLPLMRELDALGATSYGLGEVIRAAVADASALSIGLGGSATTDGAAGALQALGLGLRDASGLELKPGGAALAALASVDLTRLITPPAGGVRLLTDVTNPLLGSEGAAATFGPQKGADADGVAQLERALTRWASVLGGNPGQPGAGAAGGAGYGFAAAWGATTASGSAEIARLSGLDVALRNADVLLTGEGRFDASSYRGKVVGYALDHSQAQTEVVIVAGRVDEPPVRPGTRTVDLTKLAGSPHEAHSRPGHWLRIAGANAARRL